MMNRREFLRGVLLGAAALVLPKGEGERGGESEITGKRGPLMVVDRGGRLEHENCRCAAKYKYVPLDIGDGHQYYVQLRDDADDWFSRIQPQSLGAERIEEYLEQMRPVSEACMEYLRGAA